MHICLTILNHISRLKSFYRFSCYLLQTRSGPYFICFAYPPPFLRLAEISRQFTLCALHRFPPSRFRLPWHTYPNCIFRRLTLAVFLWNSTVSDTYLHACVLRIHVLPYDDVLVSIAEAVPNVLFCTYFPLIHPSRPLTPLTTVYQAG